MTGTIKSNAPSSGSAKGDVPCSSRTSKPFPLEQLAHDIGAAFRRMAVPPAPGHQCALRHIASSDRRDLIGLNPVLYTRNTPMRNTQQLSITLLRKWRNSSRTRSPQANMPATAKLSATDCGAHGARRGTGKMAARRSCACLRGDEGRPVESLTVEQVRASLAAAIRRRSTRANSDLSYHSVAGGAKRSSLKSGIIFPPRDRRK
jgi:hypothetical protein